MHCSQSPNHSTLSKDDEVELLIWLLCIQMFCFQPELADVSVTRFAALVTRGGLELLIFYQLLCSIGYQTFCWSFVFVVAQVCRSWNFQSISIFGKLLLYWVMKNVQAILLVYLKQIFIITKNKKIFMAKLVLCDFFFFVFLWWILITKHCWANIIWFIKVEIKIVLLFLICV